MSTPGMEEVESLLDPDIPLPPDVEPEYSEILPRGYLSVSQMSTFLNCPRSWYLRYIEKKPSKMSARPFQGIQVHKAVEAVLAAKLKTGELPPEELATDTFSMEFDAAKQFIEDWDDSTPDAVKDVGITCTKIYYAEAAPTATPVVVEKTFSVVVKTKDGDRLPILGRIDSLQVQTHTEDEYQATREKVAASMAKDPEASVAPLIKKPLRLHDLKVVTDKWGANDLPNDLQFAIYAGVEQIPDVRVDQLVKGRAKVPRPRYEALDGVITNSQVSFAMEVAEGVAKSIALAHFPPTNPGNWWCSEKWCSMWQHCRGKKT